MDPTGLEPVASCYFVQKPVEAVKFPEPERRKFRLLFGLSLFLEKRLTAKQAIYRFRRKPRLRWK